MFSDFSQNRQNRGLCECHFFSSGSIAAYCSDHPYCSAESTKIQQQTQPQEYCYCLGPSTVVHYGIGDDFNMDSSCWTLPNTEDTTRWNESDNCSGQNCCRSTMCSSTPVSTLCSSKSTKCSSDRSSTMCSLGLNASNESDMTRGTVISEDKKIKFFCGRGITLTTFKTDFRVFNAPILERKNNSAWLLCLTLPSSRRSSSRSWSSSRASLLLPRFNRRMISRPVSSPLAS